MTIDNDFFEKILYERNLPKVYREYDKPKLPLKRYLSSLNSGGYNIELKDINETLNYIDPEKCPDEYFPFLLESFGLTFYPDIDLKYQRRIVANIGGLNKRRGTYACVRFLAKILSGMECDLEYFRGEYLGQEGRFLVVTLLAMTTEDISNMSTSAFVMSRYIKEYIPYYIYVIVRAVIATQSIRLPILRASAYTQHNWNDLRTYFVYSREIEQRPVTRIPIFNQNKYYDLR